MRALISVSDKSGVVNFTKQFAKRLNGICQMEIKEAQDGDSVNMGEDLLAPGDRHMEVVREGLFKFKIILIVSIFIF